MPPDPPPSAQPAGSGAVQAEPSPRPLPVPGGADPGAPASGSVEPEGGLHSFNEATGPIEPDPRAAQKLDNALSNYRTRRYTIDDQPFQLDKAGMRYILKRHAPEYWDGSEGRTQTFFPRGTTTDQIQQAVGDVLGQNRDAIIAKPSAYQWKLYGTSGGVRYNVATDLGRVTRLVPLP